MVNPLHFMGAHSEPFDSEIDLEDVREVKPLLSDEEFYRRVYNINFEEVETLGQALTEDILTRKRESLPLNFMEGEKEIYIICIPQKSDEDSPPDEEMEIMYIQIEVIQDDTRKESHLFDATSGKKWKIGGAVASTRKRLDSELP